MRPATGKNITEEVLLACEAGERESKQRWLKVLRELESPRA